MTREISIQANGAETVRFSQSKIIKILTDPPAGTVFYNQKYLGYTPLQFFPPENDVESDEITIMKSGFQDQKFSLSAAKNEYFIHLKPAEDIQKRIINKTGLGDGGFRWSREGLVITSLASSWLSFFLKREADKNYDKYLRASDPDLMVTYYDRTQKLDTFAEIAVGISAVTLGTYFYFLLTE